MRIIVVRSGGTWFGEGHQASGLQSQDNHTAVARVLCSAGHDVMCVGRIVGNLDCPREQRRGEWSQLPWAVKPSLGVEGNIGHLMEVARLLEHWRPDALVNVCGSEMTTLSPVVAAERGITTLDACWRYGWPLVEILRVLKLPRICVVTDVRCYPRETEITWYPECLPAAVLSQQTIDHEKRVLTKRYRIRAVHSGCEAWRMIGVPVKKPRPASELLPRCAALAHAHIDEARIDQFKKQLWSYIASPPAPAIDVYGVGWQAWDMIDPPYAMGSLAPMGEIRHGPEMYETLSRYPCGPLVPMLHGWVSPKYREYAVSGCVPLPYGRGQDVLTYDHSRVTNEGHVIPLQASCRFTSPEELLDLTTRIYDNPTFRAEQLEHALHRSEPRVDKLLSCVEYFGRGGRPTAESRETWGGYEELS